MLIVLAALLLWRTLEAAGLFRPLALLVPFALLTHPIYLRLSLDRMTDLTGTIFLLGGWLFWMSCDEKHKRDGNTVLFVVLGMLAGERSVRNGRMPERRHGPSPWPRPSASS